MTALRRETQSNIDRPYAWQRLGVSVVLSTIGGAGMWAVVAPGPIWTPMIPSTTPLEASKSFGKDTPIGRPGQLKELAGIFVLLAPEEGSYMTGGIPLPKAADQVEPTFTLARL